MKKIAFLGSARCFHTYDWFKSSLKLINENTIFFTDNLSKEGFRCLIPKKNINKLFLIDYFLPIKSTNFSNRLRNILKILFIPLQICILKFKLVSNNIEFLICHSTYYGFLSSFLGVEYSITPQGSEVLIRPFNSKLYRYFLVRATEKSKFVTVDSVAMFDKLSEISNCKIHIIQNGIDTDSIQNFVINNKNVKRTNVLSIRGITPLYQTKKLLNCLPNDLSIKLCFPFQDDNYLQKIMINFPHHDYLFRLNHHELYDLLCSSSIVFSTPLSDSSPRSVYEAIFLGCYVFTTYHKFIEDLPDCMKNRIIIIDLDNDSWLDDLDKILHLQSNVSSSFIPSNESITMFNQLSCMKKYLSHIH